VLPEAVDDLCTGLDMNCSIVWCGVGAELAVLWVQPGTLPIADHQLLLVNSHVVQETGHLELVGPSTV
jgi:hypothetical protein